MLLTEWYVPPEPARTSGCAVDQASGRDPREAARTAHARALVAGGYSLGNGEFACHESVEIFDPSSNRWSAASPLDPPRFGHSATLAQLILVNTFVSLFAGFMPVPGGMGVAEAGYTAGLEAIGIPSAVAMSTAIAFRLVTFYLPPIWGAYGMRWLRQRSFV